MPTSHIVTQPTKRQHRSFMYNNEWMTTDQLCKLLNVNRKVFSRLKHKYNDNIRYMMDVKLGIKSKGFD